MAYMDVQEFGLITFHEEIWIRNTKHKASLYEAGSNNDAFYRKHHYIVNLFTSRQLTTARRYH